MSDDNKKSKKDVKKDSKNKRHFFKDFKAELKKVIWPTPKQLVNNTVAVITIVLILAIIVLVLDLAFEGLNKYGINNLRSYVETHVETKDETEQNSLEEDQNVQEEDQNIEEVPAENNEVE